MSYVTFHRFVWLWFRLCLYYDVNNFELHLICNKSMQFCFILAFLMLKGGFGSDTREMDLIFNFLIQKTSLKPVTSLHTHAENFRSRP